MPSVSFGCLWDPVRPHLERPLLQGRLPCPPPDSASVPASCFWPFLLPAALPPDQHDSNRPSLGAAQNVLNLNQAFILLAFLPQHKESFSLKPPSQERKRSLSPYASATQAPATAEVNRIIRRGLSGRLCARRAIAAQLLTGQGGPLTFPECGLHLWQCCCCQRMLHN